MSPTTAAHQVSPAAIVVPDGYQPLTVVEVPAYIRARAHLSALVPVDPLLVREVGDGNLNLVFIVRSDPGVPGVVLKQSLPWVRVFGEGWPLTLERARHEADAYEDPPAIRGGHQPGLPRIRSRAVRHRDGGPSRPASVAHSPQRGRGRGEAAADLGRLVARIAFYTSDVGMDAGDRKRQLARTINPELCRITEDLVLTEPLREHEHNWYLPALEPRVRALRADQAAIDALSVLKHRFMTRSEALIHGDLHTGSVMVGGGRTVAIDPEFACYGPVGFDLGAIWANTSSRPLGGGSSADRRRSSGTSQPSSRSPGPHSGPNSAACGRRASTPASRTACWPYGSGPSGTMPWGSLRPRSIRRMVGFAHVSDIETLEEGVRAIAADAVLRVARRLLVERAGMSGPAAAWGVVEAELTRPG